MHIDENHKKSASVQIITGSGSWCAWFPYEEFACSGNKPVVKIGENLFSEKGLRLNLKSEFLAAKGYLNFGPLSPVRYDIMGPFRYVPFMECRHSVFSMTHTVSGSLTINHEKYNFEGNTGYMEGDRGRSFPNVYIWTQCNFYDETPNSLMLSVAEIPIGPTCFTGIIGVILWHGKEYRVATYLGAKAVTIKDGTLVIKQGGYTITAKLLKKQDNLLFAPVSGDMKRMIHESLTCTAYYRFEEDGKKIFEFTTDRASFEYEYKV
jgi:hypothetical protein